MYFSITNIRINLTIKMYTFKQTLNFPSMFLLKATYLLMDISKYTIRNHNPE